MAWHAGGGGACGVCVTYSEVPGPSLTLLPPILFPLFGVLAFQYNYTNQAVTQPPLLTVAYAELIEALCKYVPLQKSNCGPSKGISLLPGQCFLDDIPQFLLGSAGATQEGRT